MPDGLWIRRTAELVLLMCCPPAPEDVHLVGLSALMTTTLKSMEETIAALHAAKLDCKVMVGGAVLTPEYAEKIGADWYAKDAKQSADIAKKFFGES